MDTIGKQKVWSFVDDDDGSGITTNSEIRRGSGHRIGSYRELATKIAELQFLNRDHVLFFRGQDGDYIMRWILAGDWQPNFASTPDRFWKNDNFPKISRDALYPAAIHDPLYQLALRVKDDLNPT